uniref:OPT oligopeptide transporter n=1 Tax=Mycena chlorophos TaxID=658473 RepID=A0ABQ0LJ46_MYCCL|nr:OPT oligopeptide transporter [Mycena chlorophos]
MSLQQDGDVGTADLPALPVLVSDEKRDSFEEKVAYSSASELEKGSTEVEEDIVQLKGDDDDPAYAALPHIVRELCDFEDDPSTPVLTWRFFVLSGVFTALGAWLMQMGFFRKVGFGRYYFDLNPGPFSVKEHVAITTYVPYSIYFVQIASLYIGKLLAATLPSKKVGFGRYYFDLNPGPFSVKEHVAIVLAANTGATNDLGDYVLAPLAVFYHQPMNGWLAILFMWSGVLIGFSFATLARSFLISNPVTVFPLTLQQVSVFGAMRASFESESRTVQRQMRVFWVIILVFFLWEFLPEYIFPFTSSLAILCWVTDNRTANFLGSGLGGAGLLNFTLDWSNIGSTAIYYPYWSQVNMFAGYVIACWILIPIGALGGAWQNDLYPMQSQSLFLANGSTYPTAKLMNADYTLNEELYAEIGPPRMGAQVRWAYFFSYAAYLGAFVSLCLFQGPMLWRTYRSVRTGQRIYHDKLNQLMESYPPVPVWWNISLFVVPTAIIIALAATGKLYLPLYTVFIALGFGALIVLPMAYVFAVSGYQVPVGYFNELLYGYLIDAGGSRHPVGSLSYRTISGQCWYMACSMLSDMKLGHYFHIPPRATLFAQVWGMMVGVPVNYATILWVVGNKEEYLNGTKTDPNKQWTFHIPPRATLFAQVWGMMVGVPVNYATILWVVGNKEEYLNGTKTDPNKQWTGIAFALVGPKKLFDDPMYTILPYGFVLGAGIPIVLYILHRRWPHAHFDKWNIPVRLVLLGHYYC